MKTECIQLNYKDKIIQLDDVNINILKEETIIIETKLTKEKEKDFMNFLPECDTPDHRISNIPTMKKHEMILEMDDNKSIVSFAGEIILDNESLLFKLQPCS